MTSKPPTEYTLLLSETSVESESEDDITKYYPKKRSVTYLDPLYIKEFAQTQQVTTSQPTDKEFQKLLKGNEGELQADLFDFYDYKPHEEQVEAESEESEESGDTRLYGFDVQDFMIQDKSIERISAQSISFTPEEDLTENEETQEEEEEVVTSATPLEDVYSLVEDLDFYYEERDEKRTIDMFPRRTYSQTSFEDMLLLEEQHDQAAEEVKISASDENIIREILEELKVQVECTIEEDFHMEEEAESVETETTALGKVGKKWKKKIKKKHAHGFHEEEVPFNREELLEMYETVMKEKHEATLINKGLQIKIAHHIKKRGIEHFLIYKKEISDAKFHEFLELAENSDKVYNDAKTKFQEMAANLNETNKSLEKEISVLYAEYARTIHRIGAIAIHSQTSTHIPKEVVDNFLVKDKESDNVIRKLRLRNIRERYKLEKIQEHLKSLVDLPDDEIISEYERLKGDFQSYQIKLEKQTNELIKLEKEYVNNVQLISHYKEKTELLKSRTEEQEDLLDNFKLKVENKLEELNRAKEAQYSSHQKLRKLHPTFGLIERGTLRLDFNELASEKAQLLGELEDLKARYVNLNPSLKNKKAFLPKIDSQIINRHSQLLQWSDL